MIDVDELGIPIAPSAPPDKYGWVPGQPECYVPDCNKLRGKPVRKGGVGMSKFCEEHEGSRFVGGGKLNGEPFRSIR